jgi:hypothetical protein
MDTLSSETLADTIKHFNTPFCSDGLFFLVKRVLKMLGVKIRKKSMKRWSKRGTNAESVMMEADLKELAEKIKHMNIL